MKMPLGQNGKKEETSGNKYLLWGLIAIELFMSFSFLGYFHIAPLSITFVYIPVLVAGCVLGPKASALMGIVFGLASMWKASAFYVGAVDAIFSPISSGKPLASILLSVGSRALFGLLSGILYQMAKKSRHPLVGVITVTSVGRTLHTLLVYGFMQLFFPEIGIGLPATWNDIRRWDFLPFLLIANGIVVGCFFYFRSEAYRRLAHRVSMVDQVNAIVPHVRKGIHVTILLVSIASFSVALYFTNRIGSMMKSYGLNLSARASYDLMHLEIQFLLGILSLAFLAVLIIIIYQRNFNYLYYEAQLDGLTGLFGRQLFFQKGEALLAEMSGDEKKPMGCFIIMDVDLFKEINDQFGHPMGDRVLRDVADELKKIFDKEGIVGRLGGDEFVVLICEPWHRKTIEAKLNHLKKEVGKILLPAGTVTCSIGVIPVEAGYSLEELYRNADRLLYEAKKTGKNRFVFGYRYQDISEK